MLPFIDDMAARLGECDVIVCRAGAITVSELCAAGVAAVLVPFVASTTSHQRDNAAWMAARDAAIHLPQGELSPRRLADLLSGLTRDALLAMATKARALARPHAAARVADEIEAMVGGMKHAVKNIHFVGIGGAGMSGIAEILHNLGYRISGSDQSESATTRALAALGIRVAIGHDAANIAGAEAVVTSSAVRSDNPEVTAARAAPHPGRAARRHARRADAPEAGHRDRRHARQDDDDLARHQRARRGRARSDLRHRRPAQRRRRRTRASAPATTSSSRPTSRTPRSSTCCR